jgi:hypothetical protein
MIGDVRNLKPGDVIKTNNAIESSLVAAMAGKEYYKIEAGVLLVILKVYTKNIDSLTLFFCDVLTNNKKQKICLLEKRNVKLPKDMLSQLYSTRSYTKVL